MKYSSLAVLSVCCLCTGCSPKTADRATIETLSRRLDALARDEAMIASNQETILNEVRSVKEITAKLPDAAAFNSMEFYYSTNTVAHVGEAVLGSEDITLTNLYRLESGQYDVQQSLWHVDSTAGSTLSILTNNLADFLYIRGKIDDVGHDVRAMKARLGVIN